MGDFLATIVDVRATDDFPADTLIHIFGAGVSGLLLRDLIDGSGRARVAGFIDSHKTGMVDGLEVVDLKTFVARFSDAPVAVASEAYTEIIDALRAAGVSRIYDAFPLIARQRWLRLQKEVDEARDQIRHLEESFIRERAESSQRGVDLHIARYFQDLQQWQNRALSGMLFGPPVPVPTPPAVIPPNLLDRYTMGGRVEVEYRYMALQYPSNYPHVFTVEEVAERRSRIARREAFAYPGTDEQLWEALERHPIAGLGVAIIGSISPWFESVCLHYGGSPTTIEYNPIISRIPGHTAMTPAAWEAERPVFDAAFSISSFEHDGLGGYGDPLDPDADLMAMKRAQQMVKPGGLLYLAVPVGTDRVVFNSHRIYGRLRLPKLLEGWTMIDSVGFDEKMLDEAGGSQPILVLRNG